MKRLDIAPFALPNREAGEYRFEETRDIEEIRIDVKVLCVPLERSILDTF